MRIQAVIVILSFSSLFGAHVQQKYNNAYCWICFQEQDNIILHYVNEHQVQTKVIHLCKLCNFTTAVTPEMFEHLKHYHHRLSEFYKCYDAIAVPRMPKTQISQARLAKYTQKLYELLDESDSSYDSELENQDDDLSWVYDLKI